jgi:hypothetical protein
VAGGLSTYDQIFRGVILRCPSASVFLARSWVDFAFRSLWDRKLWSWQRKRGQFLINQVYNTGTVDVTRGSFTITGTGTTFTSDMVGRQFRTGVNSPIYTIASFTSATSIDLTEVWGNATALSQTYSIYNAYVTVPSDFQNFISVVDVNYNWQLELNVTQEELNAWDAQRANTGTAYVVSMFDYDGFFSDPPLPRYEIWPHQKALYCYPFQYVSRPPDLSDPGATLPRYIRGDVLLEMALAQCARWPGPSKDAPNPYFNLSLAMQHEARGQEMINEMVRTDDEIDENDVTYMSTSAMPFASIPYGDARYLQSHDLG